MKSGAMNILKYVIGYFCEKFFSMRIYYRKEHNSRIIRNLGGSVSGYVDFSNPQNIQIGKGTYIAPNVGLITANHDPQKLDNHLPSKPIKLGENCWIGMNSVILPGITLGDHTIVGAGSVVTKSFPEGYCVVAGNPAKLLRTIGIEEGDGE